ncbi:hypothetical protein GJ496_000017, partial [Pomphorhynchus laevis]
VHKHHHNSKERQDYRNQGLHETEAYSRFCFTHERHPNIFIGDQRLCTASICTRDNPNAIKYGNECAEERSYYPYWAPSPWIDIAIFKKNASQCSNLIKQSQNTNSRSFCAFPSKRIAEHYRQFFGTLPISPKRCTQSKFSFNSTMTFSGKWHKGSKHNKSSPKCLKMHSRNSHYYDWRIPSLRQSKSHTKCVIRIRYNVTVFEARNPNEHTNRLKSHHPITSVDDSEIVVFPELKNFKLRLQNIRASDINQVFEDRSHVFEVIQRPPQVDVNQSIYNVNFVGHRQPDDEASNLINDIEFIPRVIHILNGTMVHMQWHECISNSECHCSNIMQLRNNDHQASVPANISTYRLFDLPINDSCRVASRCEKDHKAIDNFNLLVQPTLATQTLVSTVEHNFPFNLKAKMQINLVNTRSHQVLLGNMSEYIQTPYSLSNSNDEKLSIAAGDDELEFTIVRISPINNTEIRSGFSKWTRLLIIPEAIFQNSLFQQQNFVKLNNTNCHLIVACRINSDICFLNYSNHNFPVPSRIGCFNEDKYPPNSDESGRLL